MALPNKLMVFFIYKSTMTINTCVRGHGARFRNQMQNDKQGLPVLRKNRKLDRAEYI
jgi:hypothetical protein